MHRKTFLSGVLLLTAILTSGFLHSQDDHLNMDDYGYATTDLTVLARLPYPLECVKTVQLETPLYPGMEYRIHFWLGGQKYQNLPYTYDVELVLSQSILVSKENDFREVDPIGALPKLQVNEFSSTFQKDLIEFIVRPQEVYTYVSVGMRNRDNEERVNIKEAAEVGELFIELAGLEEVQEAEEMEVVVEVVEEEVETLTEDIPPPSGFSDESTPKLEEVAEDPAVTERPIEERELVDKGVVYNVNQGELEIALYDHKNVDGDIVTIYLNDEVVVEKLTLARKKSKFSLQLREGKNTLRLHAENLGAYAPNTVAIRIKIEGKDILEILNSDMERSEYFTLEYVVEGE